MGRLLDHAYCNGVEISFQDLTETLSIGNVEARTRAARDIRRLFTTRSFENLRTSLAAAGVIAPLVSMLQSQDFSAREASLFALLDLAVRNDSNKIGIVKAGAIPVILVLLRQGTSELREPATAALMTLSACTGNKLAIAASGAVPLLVQTLSFNSGSRQAKLDLLTVLYNLATCRQNIPAILAAGVVPSLICLLASSKKSSKFAEKATGLLELLSSSETGRNEISTVEGGILALVETIEEGSGQSREHAVRTLLAMCEGGRERYRGLILKEGVIPGLLQWTVQGSRRCQEKARALLQLLRDSNGCPAHQGDVSSDDLEIKNAGNGVGV